MGADGAQNGGDLRLQPVTRIVHARAVIDDVEILYAPDGVDGPGVRLCGDAGEAPQSSRARCDSRKYVTALMQHRSLQGMRRERFCARNFRIESAGSTRDARDSRR